MTNLTEAAAQIVSNYVANNGVRAAELPELIASVRQSLATLADPVPKPSAVSVIKLTPAQIRKSITDDGLVSFEDGKKYQMLKRHLTSLGLSPAAYRQKWGLPSDYPTVAPAHALERSASAKARGFGRRPARASVEVAPVIAPAADDRAGEGMA
jgi:predicted transcriptional regulator